MTSRIDYNNPKKSDALELPYHYEMLSDKKRIAPFKKAIKISCKNKMVLESGTGSGILSILAARSGAEKVYAIEIDHKLARFAKRNIEKCESKNIKLILKDINKITLKELNNKKVNVAIAENLSTWQVTEPQIQIMNYINKFLIKKKGLRIPSTIFNYVELTQSQYKFDKIELRTYYFEFTGIKKNKILSPKTLFSKIDLSQINPILINKTIKIKIIKNGTFNSLRLTSPLIVYDKINFDSSNSLMPPVIFPLRKDIPVKKDEIVELNIKYKCATAWEDFKCQARVINEASSQ